MIWPKIFLLSGYVHFLFLKDFAGYLIIGFFRSICKLFGEGDKYINLRVKIKILFVNTHTSIYIF